MNIFLGLIIFSLFFIIMLICYKRGKNIGLAKLEINSRNKDITISLEDYLKKIDFELLLLHYMKKEIRHLEFEYKPFSLHSVFNGAHLFLNRQPLFLEIEGPKHIIIILAKLLETEKSNLVASIK